MLRITRVNDPKEQRIVAWVPVLRGRERDRRRFASSYHGLVTAVSFYTRRRPSLRPQHVSALRRVSPRTFPTSSSSSLPPSQSSPFSTARPSSRIRRVRNTSVALRVPAPVRAVQPRSSIARSPPTTRRHGQQSLLRRVRSLGVADGAGRHLGRGRGGPADGRDLHGGPAVHRRRHCVRPAAERHRERPDQPQRPEGRAGPGRRPVRDHVSGRRAVPQLGTGQLRVRTPANGRRVHRVQVQQPTPASRKKVSVHHVRIPFKGFENKCFKCSIKSIHILVFR